MKNDYQAFFKRLFKPADEVFLKAQALVASGINLKFGLYQFHAVFPTGKVFAAKLPAPSGLILNSNLPLSEMQSIAVVVESVVSKAFESLNQPTSVSATLVPPTPEPPVVDPGPEKGIPEWMKQQAIPKAQIIKPEDEDKPVGWVPPKPKDAVKAAVQSGGTLAKATALGQKVAGTSLGSLYTVAALGPLNVAVRVSSDKDAVSVRISPPQGKSWPEAAKAKLAGAGMTDNGSYMSIHMTSLGSIPVMRVIGALMFSAEIPFTSIATSLEQLNAHA